MRLLLLTICVDTPCVLIEEAWNGDGFDEFRQHGQGGLLRSGELCQVFAHAIIIGLRGWLTGSGIFDREYRLSTLRARPGDHRFNVAFQRSNRGKGSSVRLPS